MTARPIRARHWRSRGKVTMLNEAHTASDGSSLPLHLLLTRMRHDG
jgi:hypothetical protein